MNLSHILVSIVIPVFNERDNLIPLYEEITSTIQKSGLTAEIIFVDDGSDRLHALPLFSIQKNDPRVKVIRFERNHGQTAALDAGIRLAAGQYVVTLDGDLQNVPADIPMLIKGLETFDCVCGDRTLARKQIDGNWRALTSTIANLFRNRITGENIRDSGCCFRAFKKECFQSIKLYRGMHRFLPTLFRLEGFKVTEIQIQHRRRHTGRSHYGTWKRFANGIVDCFAILWMKNRRLQYPQQNSALLRDCHSETILEKKF